jgi:uncharacterized protein DUF732
MQSRQPNYPQWQPVTPPPLSAPAINSLRALLVTLATAVALLTAACSSGHHPAAHTSSSSTVMYTTDEKRNNDFIAALQAGSYASDYETATQEDLVRYAKDLCQQLSSPAGGPGLVEIMNMTTNDAAIKSFATAAVQTYCPQATALLPNLVG